MRTVIAGCAVALAVVAVGANAGIEHTILHGVEIGRFDVIVALSGPGDEGIPADLQDRLQTRAESQLQKAGVEVTAGGLATLIVVVGVINRPEACFATVSSGLEEEAQLVRNGQRLMARSWLDERVVVVEGKGPCVVSIEGAVERAVDDFIEMYTAMNPRA